MIFVQLSKFSRLTPPLGWVR